MYEDSEVQEGGCVGLLTYHLTWYVVWGKIECLKTHLTCTKVLVLPDHLIYLNEPHCVEN